MISEKLPLSVLRSNFFVSVIVHVILFSSIGKNAIRARPSAVLLFLLWLDLLTNPQNQKQHIPHL